jgi:hypothetical protein
MNGDFQISARSYSKSIRSKTPHCFLILLLFFSSLNLSAQDFPVEYKSDSSFLNNLFGQHKEKKFKITPLPYIGYLPETRLLGGLALLLTCRVSKDSTLPFSYSELTFTYTQNHQAVLEEDIFFYIGHHYILKGYLGFEKYPDRFWGVGPTTLPGAEERYSSDRIFANLSFLRKVKGRFYVGIKYKMISIYNMNHLQGSFNLTAEEYKGNFSNGVGPAFIYDTRDNILTPSKGLYISVLNTNYGKFTGSTHQFSNYELDSRKFVRLNSKQVLAFQTTANFIVGTPPFNMYALLGSDMDMRGYYKGRFRDKDYIATQVEYRRYLFWRIGMAAFVGLGDVDNNIENLFTTLPKYSFGGGIRIKVNRKDNINLRMDYAWGNSPNSGLYAYLSEAF